MWHCDITTFYVSFSTTTSSYFLLWHLWKKRMLYFLFWGGILALIYFIFDISFYMYDNSLGDLRTWSKHDTRSSAGLSSRFVLLWCFLLFICLECLCRYVLFLLFLPFFLVLRLERLYQWIVFLLCFCAFLFLARRHALIRDAPDDLYFSPLCFLFLQHKNRKKKKKRTKKK